MATDTEDTAALGERGAPEGFWLALPDGWFPFDLTSGVAERSIDALIAARIAEDPSVAESGDELKQLLRRIAVEAQKANIEFTACYVANLAPGLPVTASLTIGLHTIGEPVTLTAIQNGLAAQGETKAIVVDSAAGPAVRVREHSTYPMPEAVGDFEVAVAQYYVPVPGRNQVALLSFTTPALPLEDDLVQLFDVMVGTFQFTWNAPDK